MSKTKNYITWGLTILIALAFIASGFMKVTGQEQAVAAFASFGLPMWFATTIGVLEIIGGVLLIIPAFTGMASAGLSIIIIGAVGCHLYFDSFMEALPAIVFLVILFYLAMTRKNIVPTFLQKCLIH